MTPSNKTDIVSSVDWILENRKKIKELHLSRGIIDKNIEKLANETIDKIEKLKKDMGKNTELNIKKDGNYYHLVQNTAGVDINQFFLQIDE